MQEKLKLAQGDGPYNTEVYLDEVHGEGASCTVFLGRRNSLDVVVKKMVSKNLDQIECEIERYNELTNINPNHTLVAFDIYNDKEGSLYKIQQINDGKIWDANKCPVEAYTLYDTLLITRSLLEIVASFHDKNILLMDITPDNVLIQNKETRVMLFDLDASVEKNQINNLDCIASKIKFAPPEFRNFPDNAENICESSDLYMVASCLYYRLFKKYFLRDPFYERLSSTNFENDGKFKDHGQIFGEQKALLIAFFQKALKFETTDRFQTASEMIEEIDKIIELIEKPHRITNTFHPTSDVCIGRENELEQIEEHFKQGNNAVILLGTGGLGKTSIAYKYAEGHKNDYEAIFKINYSTSLIYTVINRVNISNYKLKDTKQTDENYFNKKLEKIRSLVLPNKKRTLIIIDNMNNGLDPNFKDLCNLDCDILITTRNRFPENSPASTLSIDLIEDMNEAIKIFRQYYKRKCNNEEETQAENIIIEKIINRIGAFPLILRLLGNAIVRSAATLNDIESSLATADIQYPTEKITYDKDGVPLTSSIDGILEYVFDLAKIETNKEGKKNMDNIKILRSMSLIPNIGIHKSEFKKMLNLKTVDAINDLIDISIIQEDETTGIIYLHQTVSDLLRKKYKPNCQNCKKMITYLTSVSIDVGITDLKSYTDIINIYLFIESVMQNKNNKVFTYYSLQTAKLMMTFNDFTSAQKLFYAIIERNYDEYSKYYAYEYLLAIAINLDQTELAEDILGIFDSWVDFKKYPDIYLGVQDSRGWIPLGYNYNKSKNKNDVLKCISIFKDTLNEYSKNQYSTYEDEIIKNRLLGMQFSLALSYYTIAEFYTGDAEKEYYELAICQIKDLIEKNKIYKDHENQTFRYYNLLAECYVKTGKTVRARNEHRTLLKRKLKYNTELSHTVLISYRNLSLAEASIFLQDIENNFEALLKMLTAFERVAKEFSRHDFVARAYDTWIEVYIKIKDYDSLYGKLNDFLGLILQTDNSANAYKNTYKKYSSAKIKTFLEKIDECETKDKLIEVYNELEANLN